MLEEEQYVVGMWTETGRGLYPAAHSREYSGQRSPGSWGEASTIAYDPSEELLWVGYSSGFLCSFHSAELQGGVLERYTSRKIAENGVRCVMPFSLGVLAVHAGGVQLFSRGLVSKMKHVCDSCQQEDSGKGVSSGGNDGGGNERELYCCAAFNAPFMAMTDGGDSMITHVTVGGGNTLDQLDIRSFLRKSTSITIPSGSIAKSMSCGAMLAVGCEDGRVMLYDATLRHKNPQMIFVAHDGPVINTVCSPGDGYLVATVGQSAKSLNPYDENAPCTYICDPAIQVFDVRMMTARVPLCFPGFISDPCAVAFTPDGTLAVGGRSGHLALRSSSVDSFGEDACNEFHVAVDVSTGMPDGIAGIAACSSGTRLAVSCISGAVLQYTNAQSAQTGDIFVNHKSLPTIIPEFPPPRSPVNVLPYDPSPLGSKYVVRQTMEQFYSTGPLSSSMANTPWIEHQLLRRLPSKQISMTVSSVAKKRGGINTAPMPTPPYPPNSLIYGAGKTLYAQCDPRNSDATPASPSSSGTPSASVNQRNGRKGMTTTQYDMPEMYQRMRLIRGGKGHFKELDFNKHNKTSYVGLHMLYFVGPLKHAVLREQFNTRHTHPEMLSRTTGLACELGMLYHQFKLIHGLTKKYSNIMRCIHSSNVISHLKQMPEVHALGLLEDAPSQGPVPPSLPQRLETFHRFLLTELNRDLRAASPVDSLYGYMVRSVNIAVQHVNATAEGEGEGRLTRAFVAELATIQDFQRLGEENCIISFWSNQNTHSSSHCQSVIYSLLTLCLKQCVQFRSSSAYPPPPSRTTTTTSGSCFFSDLLCKSLCRRSRSRAWSPELSDFVPVIQRRSAETLPEFLPLHCGGAIRCPLTLALFRRTNARGGPWLPEVITVDVRQTAEQVCHLVVRERLDLPQGWTSSIVVGEDGGDEKLPDGVYRDSMTGDLWYQSKMESESSSTTDSDGEVNKTIQTRKYLLHALVSRIRPKQTETTSNGTSSSSLPPSMDYDEEEHAVLHVRLPQLKEEEGSKGPFSSGRKYNGDKPWLIVNDFLLEYTVLEDARSFQIPWKDPCIILFRCCEKTTGEEEEGNDEGVTVETPIVVPDRDNAAGNEEGTSSHQKLADCIESCCISSSIFETPSLGLSRAVFGGSTSHSLPDGLPQKGDIVAIDTEYLALSIEESELSEDGTRRVSRSARMSPARLSVIDARNNSVIVDDFIVQTEPVVDYLTRFSGIKPEDLDPSTSQHHLASIRTTCLKLRYLIDAGCYFVGHDLTNDFGVLNVTVPPDQIRDTVLLWKFPKKRKMSLRFLAHYVLKQDIQGETHDSVEDARVALQLYDHHKMCKADGTLNRTINRLYEYGNRVDFKARPPPPG